METILSSDVVVAYSICARKAYLLLFTEENGEIVEYIDILEQKLDSQKTAYETQEKFSSKDIRIGSSDDLKQSGALICDVKLEFENFQANCDILRKIKNDDYEPGIFIGTYGISKQDKLKLTCIAYILKEMEISVAQNGVIINAGGNKHKISLKTSSKSFRKIILSLQDWQKNPQKEYPQVFLNKSCLYCQFQNLCREKAKRDDSLSLLSGMSIKSAQRYAKKGIFTVRQLSYFFKPRRLKKQARNHQKSHKPELQALALREQKTYIQEIPNMSRQGVEIFIDFEGIPDQRFYYLLGALVCMNGVATYHSFWADTADNEKNVWQNFICLIKEYPNAPLYHYGSFEQKAITTLSTRYGDDVKEIKDRCININTFVFGKIYFPVYSNSLKDIGKFVGAKWEIPNSTGLQSIVWRYQWEKTNDILYKNYLLTYNKDDCVALKSITDRITQVKENATLSSEIDFISNPKKIVANEGAKEIHEQFETILDFAHAKYDKKKIKFRNKDNAKADNNEIHKGQKLGYQGQRKVRLIPTETIVLAPDLICPKDGETLKRIDRLSKRVIVDLVLSDDSIKKTVTEYICQQGYCQKCKRYIIPTSIRKYGPNQVYGYGFIAWVVYQRVGLRMTYSGIEDVLFEQFGEKDPAHYISNILKSASKYYERTENDIVQKLLIGRVIHADETPINVRGITQYVWTFSSDRYAILRLSQTREASIAQEFLKSYKGILVSDFYPGYDAINCIQQKCWVHLIRDLNDDLWEAPFDTELEALVFEIRNLIIPIMETVQQYGLKRDYLIGHMKSVDQFYEKMIIEKLYKSELATKYQNRFIKYKDSLFTFLQYDDVPWHNNAAERALRHITKQQQISQAFFEKVTRDYLRLLSIRQSLRFQNKSFLKFLFSGETDIDKAKD